MRRCVTRLFDPARAAKPLGPQWVIHPVGFAPEAWTAPPHRLLSYFDLLHFGRQTLCSL